MAWTRRGFLQRSLALGAGSWLGMPSTSQAGRQPARVRDYNLSVAINALEADPELLDIVRDAGVRHIWLGCFFHGQFAHPLAQIVRWKRQIEKRGMAYHVITVPLGHPSFTARQPDYTAQVAAIWKRGVRPDGRTYSGVSLHRGATEANVAALRKLITTDPGRIFLDDDFRLAPSPADIGGCFCDEHKIAFLHRHGYGEPRWDELLDDVHNRRLTTLMRAWINDTCDALTASFRAQQQATLPAAQLGIMVMYLGSEKAGIRLTDYQDVPFRVGELMFHDSDFAPVKGKTNELFSALFHRRFATPHLAYSETTAWPADKLSATNMAAKLCVSTLADVRNTMFMSGAKAFPRTHWRVLGPAMRRQAELHRRIAGHIPRGPLKHFWGEHSRWVGDANPYSLFLATGIPFEVTSRVAATGWTFLSTADARAAVAGSLASPGTTFVVRPDVGTAIDGAWRVAEALPALFACKQRILAASKETFPYVEQDVPVVCAWYPTARCVVLWNLTEQKQNLTVRWRDARRAVSVGPLATCLVEGVG